MDGGWVRCISILVGFGYDLDFSRLIRLLPEAASFIFGAFYMASAHLA